MKNKMVFDYDLKGKDYAGQEVIGSGAGNLDDVPQMRCAICGKVIKNEMYYEVILRNGIDAAIDYYCQDCYTNMENSYKCKEVK